MLLVRDEQTVPSQTTDYQWTVSGAQVSGPTDGPTLELQMPASGSVTVQLRASNSCDGVKTASWSVTVSPTAPCGPQTRQAQPALAAYPNPADATLTVSQPAGTQLTIYNAQGRAMYRGRAGAQPTPVDTRAWPEGLYYLHTGTGRTSQRHQIQVKH